MTYVRMLALAVLGACALAATARAAPHPYTRAATQSCLTRLPDVVAGLPPATPPEPPALFVDALAGQRRLGAWYAHGRTYVGMTVSFFATAPAARASFKSVASPYGGRRIGNVVVAWGQKATPGSSVQRTLVTCLRAKPSTGSPTAPRPASLATFAGSWGGHTRALSITRGGAGRERVDDGCCTRVYTLSFRILSVSGTLTHATAVYRVTSFSRQENGVRKLRVGDVGRLVLRNGIVTNALTDVYYCSDPAWGATGACGA